MTDADKTAITEALFDLVADIAPDASTREMYGGTVFEAEHGVPATLMGGVFAAKSHVTLELSHGADFDDPRGLLEGKGKFRRHLKLTSIDDIVAKDCAGFIAQAAARYA